MMRLNKLEKALLVAVVEREAPELSGKLDPSSLQVEERSMTGCGFMTTLCVTEATQVFSKGVSLRLGNRTFAVINGAEDIGVLVYVDDGKITALEGYTFGGRTWPEKVQEFTIEHLGGPRPVLARSAVVGSL